MRHRPDSDAAAAPRLLVVEDDYIVGMELRLGPQEAGFEVVGVARSAEEAIAVARATHPVLAIMDIRLHGRRDGVDAAIELCRTDGVRCIFVTAHQEPEVQARAAAAGPLGWVVKPYEMATVIAAVRQAARQLAG